MAKKKISEEEELFTDIPIEEEKVKEAKAEEKVEPEEDDGEEIVKNLKAQLETLQKEKEAESTARKVAEEARITAEKGRVEETTKAQTAFQSQIAAQQSSIDNAIAASIAELASAEQEYERAREAGDLKAEIAAQKKLSRATNLADQWEAEKNRFDDWKTKHAEEQKKVVSQNPVGQATKDWIDAHPKFNTDDEYRESAIHFHKLAVKKGIVPETKGYFDYINSSLDRVFEPAKEVKKVDKVEEDEEETGIETSSIAASPSRDTAQGVPEKKTRIRLTAGQMAAVNAMMDREKITREQAAIRYLKQREKLISAGRIQETA